MTTLTRRAALAALCATAACAAPPRGRTQAQGGGQATPPPPPPPPPLLARRLEEIATRFDGRYGLSVRDVAAGWTAGHDGAALYPQQSVAKLWTALAVFDAVDRGALRLDRTVHVTRADMSVFHQPLRARVGSAGLDLDVQALLEGALAQSDNACDDILIRLVGEAAPQRAVDSRGLGAIRAGPQERYLQTRIAGLAWRPELAVGDAFERARDKLDPALRRARLAAYLADPPEGAAPDAMTGALARLHAGELLSPASTAAFLAILAATTTGPMRLKAGLPPGWTIAHKTGTGQDLYGLSTGFNDVAVVTAPDGRVYTLAAMIASTSRPVPERQLAMQDVARAVAAWREGTLA